MDRGGKLIKIARKARGMSQEYIAEAIGGKTTERTIRRWETFDTEPPFNMVFIIIETICKLTLDEVEELVYANH